MKGNAIHAESQALKLSVLERSFP